MQAVHSILAMTPMRLPLRRPVPGSSPFRWPRRMTGPSSAFRHGAENTGPDWLVRFAFCKSTEVLREATARPAGLRKG